MSISRKTNFNGRDFYDSYSSVHHLGIYYSAGFYLPVCFLNSVFLNL